MSLHVNKIGGTGPNGEDVVADIHSHGKYEQQYSNNDFSKTDTDDNDAQGIDGYVSTPNGSLQIRP